MRGKSRLAENRLASQEGIRSIGSVSIKPTSASLHFVPLPLSTRILTKFTTLEMFSEAKHLFIHRVPRPPGHTPDSCPHSRNFFGPVDLTMTFIFASPTAYTPTH